MKKPEFQKFLKKISATYEKHKKLEQSLLHNNSNSNSDAEEEEDENEEEEETNPNTPIAVTITETDSETLQQSNSNKRPASDTNLKTSKKSKKNE